MIVSDAAKECSTTVRRNAFQVFHRVSDAFQKAIVGCADERKFLQNFRCELADSLSQLAVPAAKFECRVSEIHQRPIVSTDQDSCELGDLLVVVKYHLLDGTVETKSVIYQVKLTQANSRRCQINPKQLRLLRDWPPFQFGGRPYLIRPTTAEFGSFMLEPRRARSSAAINPFYFVAPGVPIWPWAAARPIFGLCPTAWQVNQDGPLSVNLDKLAHALPDAIAVVNQIAFTLGEHHCNKEVDDLISALYRRVGFEPDPPGEFSEYSEVSDDDGFLILEINVKQTPEGDQRPARKQV